MTSITHFAASGWVESRPAVLNSSMDGEMVQHEIPWAWASSQVSWKNRKGIAPASLAVYIGTGIAYKHGDSPWGQSAGRRKIMAIKKPTKRLKKSKKLVEVKPLTKPWSGGDGDGGD
jgi:hypothetical protein